MKKRTSKREVEMRILTDIGHPAHVHLFKNMIWDLEKKGYEIKITARDKDVALVLLDAYELEYENRGKGYGGLFGKVTGLIKINHRLYKIARRFKPDVLIGVHNPYIAQVGKLIRKPSIIFTDSEPVLIASWLTFPFCDSILVPSCFRKDLGSKSVRYKGYHELAYLHPNHFKPDPAILEELNLSKSDKFVILRFVAWQASHDIGQSGFDLETKQRLVKEIEKHARVFITSERPLPKEFEKYRITIPPHRIHDMLYYAQMLIGDTQTMTTEAGILGTPAIRCNSFVGENDMGNFIELEKKYGLIYSYRDPNDALNKALELLKNDNLKKEWQKKREKLLNEKIDVTKFMVEFIENYPQSFYELVQSQNKKQVI